MGTVVELKPWRGESDRMKFGVRVRWDNGQINLYRWGAQNAYDVEVVGSVDPSEQLEATTGTQLPPSCPEAEVSTLRQFFDALDGHHWISKRGWTEEDSDPCFDRWEGIKCFQGRVFSMYVSMCRPSLRTRHRICTFMLTFRP